LDGESFKVNMTHTQYRKAIEVLGLTQDGAAQFLGVSIRTSNAYANGAPIPVVTAKLFRHMIKHGFMPEDVT
jgi:DNA-binding XRE family transcriptional regulator